MGVHRILVRVASPEIAGRQRDPSDRIDPRPVPDADAMPDPPDALAPFKMVDITKAVDQVVEETVLPTTEVMGFGVGLGLRSTVGERFDVGMAREMMRVLEEIPYTPLEGLEEATDRALAIAVIVVGVGVVAALDEGYVAAIDPAPITRQHIANRLLVPEPFVVRRHVGSPLDLASEASPAFQTVERIGRSPASQRSRSRGCGHLGAEGGLTRSPRAHRGRSAGRRNPLRRAPPQAAEGDRRGRARP